MAEHEISNYNVFQVLCGLWKEGGGVMQGLQLLDRFDHNSREGLHGPVTVGAHPNAFRKVQLLDFDPIIVGQIRRQPQWEPSNIHGS